MFSSNTTIAAVATAPGRGGIGIVRVSGTKARTIGEAICRKTFTPRRAHFSDFYDAEQHIIDQGVALFFQAPDSFTGEDVVELQGHGGPVVMDVLLQAVLSLGATLAQPGEFSQRAFLNDKIDLCQAEAIADLIDASSRQGARNAMHSLQGQFSQRVHTLVENLTRLRMYVEAAIDFPEEEIDFLSDGKIAADLNALIEQLAALRQQSQRGVLLREGIRVAIAGKPNAGKSSLLNALTERESAIVTNIAGTTRDVLREHIQLDGLPLHLIDTAGLRDNPDVVERIGIERAQAEFQQADRILLVVDSLELVEFDSLELAESDSSEARGLELAMLWPAGVGDMPDAGKITIVCNKVDVSGETAGLVQDEPVPTIGVSALTGAGLDDLKTHLKTVAGFTGAGEGSFTARRRHLDALDRAADFLAHGRQQLLANQAGELLAEDLRTAQQALGEITGAVTPDELLGRIFASFCIGK